MRGYALAQDTQTVSLGMRPFLIPKDPLLRLSHLLPTRHRNTLPNLFHQRQTEYVFWGRNAIYYAVRTLGITPGDTVLVPSYLCAAAIEPILQCGVTVKFYNLLPDCTPDFDDLETKVDATSKAVLIVHYFGLPQPVERWTSFCRTHGLLLIEDCAHVLPGPGERSILGSIGDVSVFSLRKFFPLYDGGQLVVNNPRFKAVIPWEIPPLLFSFKVAKNLLDRLAADSGGILANALAQMLKLPAATAQWLLSHTRGAAQTLKVNSYSLHFDQWSMNLPMSQFSRMILERTYHAEIIHRRRRNYNTLRSFLSEFTELHFFSGELVEGICPWVFPVLAPGVQDFHLKLRDMGIPATTWGGVVHPQVPLDAFPNAKYLYRNLVFLPIHQDITTRHLAMIVDAIRRVLHKHRTRKSLVIEPTALLNDSVKPAVLK